MVGLSFKWSHFCLWGTGLQVMKVILCNASDMAFHSLMTRSSRRFNLAGSHCWRWHWFITAHSNLRAKPWGQLLIWLAHSYHLSSQERPSPHALLSSVIFHRLIANQTEAQWFYVTLFRCLVQGASRVGGADRERDSELLFVSGLNWGFDGLRIWVFKEIQA